MNQNFINLNLLKYLFSFTFNLIDNNNEGHVVRLRVESQATLEL